MTGQLPAVFLTIEHFPRKHISLAVNSSINYSQVYFLIIIKSNIILTAIKCVIHKSSNESNDRPVMDFYIIHGLILCLWPTLKKGQNFFGILVSSLQLSTFVNV